MLDTSQTITDVDHPGRALLEVDHLSVRYHSDRGPVSAVDDITFSVGRSEVLGLVGESGCGKTTVASAVLGLLPRRAEVHGSITYDGEQLVGAAPDRLRRLRGSRIATIVQDPTASLDPTFSIGEQIAEAVRAHAAVSRAVARRRALDVLGEVGIPDPRARYGDPPHRLSGGMRQRVVIAAALVNDPSLIIADEPTTALDVTIQAQILDILRELVREERTALILITHDLGVVAGMCERVNVMYGGMFMETASAEDLFASPRHPYTLGLLESIPRLDASRREQLKPIPGAPRDMLSPPAACPFQPRCRFEVDASRQEVPPLVEIEPDHHVACFNPVPADLWERERAPA
jgi:peptide/nickel transport system ATP-binding protein